MDIKVPNFKFDSVISKFGKVLDGPGRQSLKFALIAEAVISDSSALGPPAGQS